MVDADELDWVGACVGLLCVEDDEELELEEVELAAVFVLFGEVFTVARVLAFRVDLRAVDVLAVEVLVVVDAAVDLTTCVLPVATRAAIRAVAAAAVAAVQRVMHLTRRRLAARILVSRVCVFIATAHETSGVWQPASSDL